MHLPTRLRTCLLALLCVVVHVEAAAPRIGNGPIEPKIMVVAMVSLLQNKCAMSQLTKAVGARGPGLV
jgi:hypothetical protein